MKYVNIYLVDRAYGGPEEGGWYYDCGQVVKSIECDAANAEIVATALRKAYDKENSIRMSDIGSVNSEGRYEVWVEDDKGQDFPSEKPYYC